MKAIAQKTYEISPIRLTSDETRLLVRASISTDPIEHYPAAALAHLGLLKTVSSNTRQIQKELSGAWKKLASYVRERKRAQATYELEHIEELQKGLSKKESYVITETGREVARGLSVKVAAKR